MSRPLEGLRVLDFSRVLSGPHCGRMLADMGADVVKIEPPQGDLTRFAFPRVNSMALYYAQQNAGKRNLSLDLRHPEAAPLLRRLAAHADVVIENFRPGVMARMGLGYDDLAAVNPALVYGSISGYGQEGPWSDRRAYAVVAHAETGMTHGTIEHRDGDLRNEPYSHADVYAGLECLAAILAALHMRHRTGTGQHVDVSMASSLLAVNEHVQAELSDVDVGDEIPSLGPGHSPVLETREGHRITIAGDPCASHSFLLFCEVLERPDLAEDPRFATVGARRANRAELLAIVQAWVLTFDDLDRLEAALGSVRLPMGVVRTVREIADSDWAAHRGAITSVSDRGGGEIRIPDSPWRFSAAEVGVAGDPAYRGEHNREVLAEVLGLDNAELDRLETDGVLSSRVPGHGPRPAGPRRPPPTSAS